MVKKLTILYVLEPFLASPNDLMHIAQIAKELNVPNPTVRKHLNFLETKGLLEKEIKGRLTLYSLRRDASNLIDYLTIAEKSRLIERCEHELILRELVRFLQANLSEKNKAAIFGSATLSARKANDVDLLISGKFDKKALDEFAKRYNIEIHPINVGRLKDVNDALRKEILKKHLLVKGSEELLRWLLS